MSLGERFASEILVEAAKKALEKKEADPFDIALEVGPSITRHLLDRRLLEKAPFLVEKEKEFAEEVAALIADILACRKEYVEKARRFYTALILGRIPFSPTTRCIYVERKRNNTIEVDCVEEKRALYEYMLGDSKPIFLLEDPATEKSREGEGKQ